MTEEQVQREVLRELKTRGVSGLMYWHTPNGGKRGAIEGARFKAMGVRAGVSDIIAVHCGRIFALELKALTGRPPTEAQMQFISDLNAAGGIASIAAGLSEAVKVLECWGLLKGRSW